MDLISTGNEEREVMGIWSISVAILPSCKYMKNIAVYLHKHEYSLTVNKGNTYMQYSGPNIPLGHHTDSGPTDVCQCIS